MGRKTGRQTAMERGCVPNIADHPTLSEISLRLTVRFSTEILDAAATPSTMRAAIHSLEARTNDGAAPNQEEISPDIKRESERPHHQPTNPTCSLSQPKSRSPLSAVISHPLPLREAQPDPRESVDRPTDRH